MSETYEIKGTIFKLSEVQSFDSGFSKQEFVVDTGGEYPQQIKLEAIRDAINSLANASVGNEVTVKFNLRGNEYNERFFVNLQAWSIRIEGGHQSNAQHQQQQPPAQQAQQPSQAPVPQDDIPF